MSERLPENLSAVLSPYSDSDKNLIAKAYVYARTLHKGQKRKSGEDYVNHPVRVAVNLAKNGFDLPTVIAGLLHDVLEDTEADSDQIRINFGEQVATIVDGVTKVSLFKIKDKSTVFRDSKLFLERVDNYKKILFASVKDVRILAVKLYDRLDNVETIEWMPEQKQKFYARETIEIFAPIAERLGMGVLRGQLQDEAFPYAYPKEYKIFINDIGDIYQNTSGFMNSIIPDVKAKVEAANINITSIAGRAKSYYSLYKKLERKGSLSAIHDILALRIVVSSVEDCYKTLGVIHALYEPLPQKIKDYIARPKVNGYQSIHTTVRDKDNNKFEVQIRTEAMHDKAENGLMSHWNYKENNPDSKDNSVSEWVEELEKLKYISGRKEFLSELKENFFAHQIFVFTPKGDIIRLPVGSTPIDFAYSIHTSLGHRTQGAKINGHIVPLHLQLKTGDTVEIIAGKTLNPKEDWLKIAKTAQAKRKIKTLTKIKHEPILIDNGQKKIYELISKYNLPPLNKAQAEKNIRDSLVPYTSLDKAFQAIAEGNFGAVKLLKAVYPSFKTTEIRSFTLSASDSLVIPALKNIPHELAKCCKPEKDSEVIGYLGRQPVIKIHRLNCKRLQNVDKRRLIQLS